MGALFEFPADMGFDPDDLQTEALRLNGTVITFLAHDSYMQQLFANEGNNHVAIKITDFDKYPNSRASWLSVSRTWINLVKNRPNLKDYYFVLSKNLYDQLKDNTFSGNTISFRLGKRLNDSIVGYLVYGAYEDSTGGGGGGLLHGAVVPPP